MKKIFVIPLLFAMFLMIFSSSTNAYFPDQNSEEIVSNPSDGLLNVEENVVKEDFMTLDSIEEELKYNGTSIDEQLDIFLKEELKYFSSEEASLVKNMITEGKKEIEDIQIKKDIINKKIQTRAFLPDFKFDPASTDMAVANAAIAYFNYHGYNLSAHLLSRAISVRSSSTYLVPNGRKDFLYNTIAYKGLCNRSRYKAGNTYDATFQNRYGNKNEADAYYAIRKFKAGITDTRINIRDRYDYNEGSDGGTMGNAIDALARLQKRGLFVAYDISIPLVRN